MRGGIGGLVPVAVVDQTTTVVPVVAVASLLLMTPAAGGQAPGPAPLPGRLTLAETTAVDPASPRASLSEYLSLCRQGRYTEAARFLNLTGRQEADAEGPRLARRLKAVLDRHLWIDLSEVSPLAEGDREDGMADVDQVGSIRVAPGRSDPVRLLRIEDSGEVRWAFSPRTVARIDGWYEALEGRWLREHLPEVLLRPGPRELLWWQWLALPLLVSVAAGAGMLLGRLSRRVLGRVFARTRTRGDDALLERLAGPLGLAWTLLVASLILPGLGLYAPAEEFARGVLGAGVTVALFWGLWRSVDIAGELVRSSAWGREEPSASSLLSVGMRIGKLGVLSMGLIAGLSQLGYPVVSLLAGLGIGGVALAFAAQKSVENVFGSVSLALDRPFHVGDFVKVEDFVGTVEAIGLRSTRIRTLDRTLISIPNGRLADMRLESFSARDRMRLACTLGLVYGTTSAQMLEVLAGLEGVLRSHPKIWPGTVVVRFKEFAASSLDIEVMAWFETPDWGEFQFIRQEVLLQFMEVMERAGTSFAFPTRTVHLVRGDASPTGPEEKT